MTGLPPAPRDTNVSALSIMDDMHSGILAACCVCLHSSAWWWCRDRTYYPLHQRCVDRLLELWREMGDQPSAALGGARRTGAYARRAVAQPSDTVAAPPSVDGGSPYFRPGMTQGAHWVACALTVAGVSVVPTGHNELHARRVTRNWSTLGRQGGAGSNGALLVGCCVVGPDGTISDVWGQCPPLPGEPMPWEPISRLVDWSTCAGCQARLWPGRWRGQASSRCLDCLRASSPRPVWPADSECSGVDPLTVKPKSARRRMEAKIVD
jgi:hypothetical protein